MGEEGHAAAVAAPIAAESRQHTRQRLGEGAAEEESCDFCGATRALLSCRADAARLCLACDRHVHAANSVSSRHRRAPLCDACRASPASILCFSASCRSLLCSNCDFDAHGRARLLHDRRPVEGFSGCPSAAALFAALGVGGDEKEVLGADADEVGDYLVEDSSIWEAPAVLSLADLIVPTTATHGFQAIVPPSLPKHQTSSCGRHSDEIIRQIRELAKLERSATSNQGLHEPVIDSYSWVSEQNIQTDCMGSHLIKSWIEPTIYEDIALEGNHSDCHESFSTSDLPNPEMYNLGSSVVNLSSLNEADEVHAGVSNACDISKGHATSLPEEELQHLPPKDVQEFSYPDRNSVISRYKEKRKTRRYDKLIRYESRKVRANSRLRIKGRFAKMNTSL